MNEREKSVNENIYMKTFEVKKSDNGGRKVKLLTVNCESDDIES